jgi:transposase
MMRCQMKQRRSFSPEFKVSAASLVLDQSYSHMDACRSVGVAESVLRRWVQQLGEERQGRTPSNPAMTTDQRRIQELEARIERLEREKTILKKATALLMSEGIERTR